MIKSNELRLGNYVKFNDKEVIVFTLGERFIEYAYEMDDEFIYCEAYEDIEPIQLTEEILLKCGFRLLENKTYVHKRIAFFVILNENGFDLNFWQGSSFKHLHQLQNLYFALTNEELQINL